MHSSQVRSPKQEDPATRGNHKNAIRFVIRNFLCPNTENNEIHVYSATLYVMLRQRGTQLLVYYANELAQSITPQIKAGKGPAPFPCASGGVRT